MGNIRRRLEALEGSKQTEPVDRTEVRERMRANFDRIAKLRSTDGPEAVAELEAFREAVERQRAKMRGEGGR